MAFMLMQTPDPLTLKDALPNFTRTTHIFLPINDARNVSVAEGGSHWSLLLVSVIDGVAFTYEAMTAFNLVDYIKYSMTVPGGIYNTTWFFVVNEDKWNSLSEEDRAAIDAISGEAFAERVGQAWNDADTAAQEVVGDKVEFYAAGPEVVGALRDAAGTLEASWAEGLGEGYDGAAALEEFRAMTGVSVE